MGMKWSWHLIPLSALAFVHTHSSRTCVTCCATTRCAERRQGNLHCSGYIFFRGSALHGDYTLTQLVSILFRLTTSQLAFSLSREREMEWGRCKYEPACKALLLSGLIEDDCKLQTPQSSCLTHNSKIYEININMASELIVDFPPKRNHDAVRFAETAQLHIVHRHEAGKKELWYTEAEYDSMKRNIKRDVLQARASASDSESRKDSGFWIGIAHLLTPVCMHEVQACRSRCVRAVLAEQARQGPSAGLRSDDIALASSAETKKAVLRAAILGRLHQESIWQTTDLLKDQVDYNRRNKYKFDSQ